MAPVGQQYWGGVSLSELVFAKSHSGPHGQDYSYPTWASTGTYRSPKDKPSEEFVGSGTTAHFRMGSLPLTEPPAPAHPRLLGTQQDGPWATTHRRFAI
jgi:hypothetical protein